MPIKDSLNAINGNMGIWSDNLAGHDFASDPSKQIGNQWGSFSDYYKGMATDPSKRGYDASTINSMRGNATGAVAGSMRSAAEDTSRQLAASGLGHTGMGARLASDRGRQSASAMREANRDIDIADAEAKRNDLWNASQAWMSGITGQQSAITDAAKVRAAGIPALTGAHDVSFWGDFGDVTQGIGNLANAGSVWQ
jgi:hypothetical protein